MTAMPQTRNRDPGDDRRHAVEDADDEVVEDDEGDEEHYAFEHRGLERNHTANVDRDGRGCRDEKQFDRSIERGAVNYDRPVDEEGTRPGGKHHQDRESIELQIEREVNWERVSADGYEQDDREHQAEEDLPAQNPVMPGDQCGDEDQQCGGRLHAPSDHDRAREHHREGRNQT